MSLRLSSYNTLFGQSTARSLRRPIIGPNPVYSHRFVLERVTHTKKSDGSLNICIIYCLYKNKTSDQIQIFFQEFTNMYKINHMKKLIEDLDFFRTYFRVRQEVSDEIQTNISFIKYELQNSIENNISCKKRNEKSFC